MTRNHAIGFEGRDGDRVHGAVHPTWASGAKHVELVGDVGYVVAAGWDFGGDFFGVESTAPARWRYVGTTMWRLCVVYYEFGAEEI